MENNNTQIGIINEIGDLGLGFEELTEQQQEQVKENLKEKKDR
jgi:hypothetical protein|uniref:Uncharacterized protein n=1 Tax=Myoviridae sp. ctYA416 TaxID=2825125 RepID=A0A8S5UTD2_9CAUD|nr:MAG TPA: hypothetical protein [Myoviridae sp. ctYA416]